MTFALVVDEYGGITGIVTMEDLLECIFGDIPSPSDETQKANIKETGRGRYAVDGSTLISDFNQRIGSALSEKWAETVGGLLLHEHGELPHKGTVIMLNELRFTVSEVKDNRIIRVTLEKIKIYDEDDDSDEDDSHKALQTTTINLPSESTEDADQSAESSSEAESADSESESAAQEVSQSEESDGSNAMDSTDSVENSETSEAKDK